MESIRFFGCILTCVLSNWCAKAFLNLEIKGATNRWQSVMLLTIIGWFMDVYTNCSKTMNSCNVSKIAYNIFELLILFSSNYSLALLSISTTFIIKLTEPLIYRILSHFVLNSKQFDKTLLISIPFVIFGVKLFIENFGNGSLIVGICYVLVSNIFIFINKTISSSSWSHTFGSRHKILNCVICMCLIISVSLICNMNGLLHRETMLALMSVIISGLFYALYRSVLSSMIEDDLKHNFHKDAFACDVFAILILLGTENRILEPWHWLGLSLCILGIGLQVYTDTNSTLRSNVSSKLIISKSDESSVKRNQIIKYLLLGILVIVLVVSKTTFIHKVQLSTEHRDVYFDTRSAYTHNIAANQQPNSISDNNILLQNFEFLSKSLVDYPGEVDTMVKQLGNSRSVINEIQRIHFNLFSDLLKPYKFVFLMDISHTESKGDPAITAGEVLLIRRLNKTLVHYCSEECCTDHNLEEAVKISKLYRVQELVILLQGGGNLVGWATHDVLRGNIFKLFQGFSFIMFPQTVLMSYEPEHLEFCHQLYQNQANLTMLFRDRPSYELGKAHFTGKAKLILAPDIAFQLGPKFRIMDPSYDIVWLKRQDKESPGYDIPIDDIPDSVTYVTNDWVQWSTQHDGNPITDAFLMVNSGFTFLQQGRVVITDRLHGHIFSVLMDIPHILISNKYKKLEGFHETWTKSLENVNIAQNASHAVQLAIHLLDKYNDILPPKLHFLSIRQPCL